MHGCWRWKHTTVKVMMSVFSAATMLLKMIQCTNALVEEDVVPFDWISHCDHYATTDYWILT